jgi:hypothetical protein
MAEDNPALRPMPAVNDPPRSSSRSPSSGPVARAWLRFDSAPSTGGGHAVDHLARGRLVERGASGHDPVGKAIAAKSGKAHKVDILRVMAMTQMADQMTKGSSSMRIIQFVQRIGIVCSAFIFMSIRRGLFLGLPSAFAIGCTSSEREKSV